MPDWRLEIEQQLRDLKLEPAREADIIEELCQHLEDRYQELLAGGSTESDHRGHYEHHPPRHQSRRRVDRHCR